MEQNNINNEIDLYTVKCMSGPQNCNGVSTRSMNYQNANVITYFKCVMQVQSN
jgi:hypothetical protein